VGPTSIYRPFFQTSTHHSGSPQCPFLDLSSATGSTSHHLHHNNPWASFNPKPLGRHFFTLIRYAYTCSHLSNTCSQIRFSSDIVHVGYLVFMCAGTWSSYIDTTPSGIYSALESSHPLCIALTFPVTPFDIFL
jgi:hypothetical protein